MFRRATALVVALAFFTACSAHVQINSNPQGARVWVNEREIGTTPASTVLAYNAFTHHRVRLEKPGYETYRGTLRTDINVGSLLAGLFCFCLLPALIWVVMPAPMQSFELVPLGGTTPGAPPGPSATPFPQQDAAPAGAGRTFTIVPGVPAVGAPRFFPAMEAAALEKMFKVWRGEDAVQIEPEPRVTMRYVLRGDGIVLDAAIAGDATAADEARVRALHDELFALATRNAERARAFESAPRPAPTPGPAVEPTPPPAPAPTATPAKAKRGSVDLAREAREKRCATGADCDRGEFCKDRGDGVKLCMGNNVRGEFCASGIDCAPGLFCKDRGDGLKVCMGKGRRGDPCVSGVDCDGTLRCRDGGDGFKTCM